MKTLSVNGIALTEERIKELIEEYNLPDYMASPIYLYLTHAIPPGSFLMAVLSNDLMRAVACADYANGIHLSDWAKFLYNEVPSASFGSREKVECWLSTRKLED